MPILDPPLQCCLLNKFNKNNNTSGINFFLYYLRIASHYMNKNITTIETSCNFKNDLKSSILFLNKELGCNFKVDSDFNLTIYDFYKYLYDHIVIGSDKAKNSKIQKGSFYICNDQFNTKFFQPCVFYPEQHAWFFSDTPIAILCINNDRIFQAFKDLVKLEIDLMVAAGFTLVLCAACTIDTIDFYLQLIKENQFSEIHFNILDESFVPKFFEIIQNKGKSHFDNFDGYFYLYSNFAGSIATDIIKNYKERPKFKLIFFCEPLEDTFKKVDLFKAKPFIYCKTGFKSKYLRVHLSNVPIYDKDDTFLKTSGVSLGYISPTDFFRWSKKRIEILFDDFEENNQHSKKFINFNDIHKIRPDLYVNQTISLMDISKQKLKEVYIIKKNINKKDDKSSKFKKEYIFSLFKDKKIIEGLEYVGYAYTKCFKDTIGDFSLHEAQLLTALDACKTFVSKIDSKDDKGVIYQVETGEGKSCIVCLIAAVLALMKKSVHITSSNIKLANRDYKRSLKFFRMLGFESAVLLHENELPYSTKKKTIDDDDEDDGDSKLTTKNSEPNLELKGMDLKDDKFFGRNSSSYFQNAIENENSEYKIDYYPGKFFKPKLFKNSSRMNFSVCGIDNNNKLSKVNQANIVFSTFVNFECLYLRMMESCQGYVNEYFNSCALLIDEADSILIDEIANGTIVSREMKSNAKPILRYVYKQRMKKKTARETFKNITKHWPNCGPLKLSDIEQMYEEIDLVNEEEFSNGKKYSIETFQVRNSSKVKRFYKKTAKFIEKNSEKIEKKIEKVKKKVRDKIKGNETVVVDEEEDDDDNEEEDNNDFEDEEEEIADSPTIEFKHIVPFDYDHKGILEPNKEFSGFIQQFIAIKESLKEGNENMIVKDLAMNYLYVSHPIFAKLYGKVCGFTGTVGKKREQRIYRKMYKLNTSKVPRHKPNLRVELPMILCQSFEQRNKIIVDEVKTFHDKEFPVLVIFQDLKEISSVAFLLNSKNIKYINIFDGKNEYVRPDKIAGLKGAVSLGTNVCGRGTDILAQTKPLHVILTYYSSNSRVMRQAYGRTARQGQKGTYRVICLKDQYYNKIEQIDGNSINNSISEFGFKNKQQEKFINHFKEHRPWIFSGDIKKQSLTRKQIKYMRETRINVNRIVAYNYQFPICMKVKTFLSIQAQRIFSIFNCPNSKYTWILFQKYIREMILESWSLMLNKLDKKLIENQQISEYNFKLINKTKSLCKKIEKYIPIPNKPNDADIIPTFMKIFEIVRDEYQDNILSIYKSIPETFKQFNPEGFCSCQFGFRLYSLLTNSGARINLDNITEMNYIIDPELRYIQAMPKGRLSILSITQRIDVIFNLICKKINQVIGEKIGLKFFLRRTLGGCEFGICFDAILKVCDSNNPLLNDYYCLIDKDPLFLFTIFIKNTSPILAGILIIVLVYVATVATQIVSWITVFPANCSKLILKKCLKLIINYAADKVISSILEKIVKYLEGVVDKQIDEILNINENYGLILKNIFDIFKNITFDGLNDSFSDFLGCKIKVKTNFGNLFKDNFNYSLLLKFGFYLILCIGSFIMNFNNNKQSVKNENKDAKSFNKKHNKEKAIKLKKKNEDKVKLNDIKKSKDDNIDGRDVENLLKLTESFLIQMKLNDPSKFKVKFTDFIYDSKPISNRNRVGNSYYSFHIYIKNMKKCFHIQYFDKTESFKQEILLYSTFNCPLIVPFIGFYVERRNNFLCLELPIRGFLDEYIKKPDKDMHWCSSVKFIIAYGVAYVMKYLHDCHVIHRDLQPANICLDDLLYPYLFNFAYARHIDEPPQLVNPLKETTLRFMAPEFIKNPSVVQNSFKIDVYSYGMLLYNLMTEIEPFDNYTSKEELKNAVISGKRPEFPRSVDIEWIKLISKCWDQNPNNRPTFKMILNELNSLRFLRLDSTDFVLKLYKKHFSID